LFAEVSRLATYFGLDGNSPHRKRLPTRREIAARAAGGDRAGDRGGERTGDRGADTSGDVIHRAGDGHADAHGSKPDESKNGDAPRHGPDGKRPDARLAAVARPPLRLDKDVVLDRVGGDADLLRELVTLFLDQSKSLRDDLRAAVSVRDASSLTRAAHKLRGSVGVFGPNAVFDLATQLDDMGRSGDLTHVQAVHADLEAAIEQLMPALAGLTAGEIR
jgi:HPt (histidine-containing phosphotransfer) domain-containing protein